MKVAQARRLAERVAEVETSGRELARLATDETATDDDLTRGGDRYVQAINSRNVVFDEARGAKLGERESGVVEPDGDDGPATPSEHDVGDPPPQS